MTVDPARDECIWLAAAVLAIRRHPVDAASVASAGEVPRARRVAAWKWARRQSLAERLGAGASRLIAADAASELPGHSGSIHIRIVITHRGGGCHAPPKRGGVAAPHGRIPAALAHASACNGGDAADLGATPGQGEQDEEQEDSFLARRGARGADGGHRDRASGS